MARWHLLATAEARLTKQETAWTYSLERISENLRQDSSTGSRDAIHERVRHGGVTEVAQIPGVKSSSVNLYHPEGTFFFPDERGRSGTGPNSRNSNF